MSFTVHHFTNNERDETRDELLSLGRETLEFASGSNNGWVDAIPSSSTQFVAFQLNERYYSHPTPLHEVIQTVSRVFHGHDQTTTLPCGPSELADADSQDLEEFHHDSELWPTQLSEERLEGPCNTIPRSFSSLQQHQPEAQSTPFISATSQEPHGLPFEYEGVEHVYPHADVTSMFNSQCIEPSTPEVARGGIALQGDLSLLQALSSSDEFHASLLSHKIGNHSGIHPPSGRSLRPSLPSQLQPSSKNESTGVSSTESAVLVQLVSDSIALVLSEPSPAKLSDCAVPSSSPHAATFPSPPPAQHPRADLSRSLDAYQESAPKPPPSWPAQDFTSELYAQRQASAEFGFTRFSDEHESFMLRDPSSNAYGSWHKSSSFAEEVHMDVSHMKSQSYAEQPSAYQAFPTTVPSQAFSFASSASRQDSQPSAYRAQSPMFEDSRSFVLPSSANPKALSHVESPHGEDSSSSKAGTIPRNQTDTHNDADTQASQEIPGLVIPSATLISSHKAVLSTPIPPSSPIQDFTTILSLQPLANIPDSTNPSRDGQTESLRGPRWKVPVIPSQSLAKTKDGEDDILLSPIEEFPAAGLADGGRIDSREVSVTRSELSPNAETTALVVKGTGTDAAIIFQDQSGEDGLMQEPAQPVEGTHTTGWDEAGLIHERKEDDSEDEDSLYATDVTSILPPELALTNERQVLRTSSDIELYGTGYETNKGRATNVDADPCVQRKPIEQNSETVDRSPPKLIAQPILESSRAVASVHKPSADDGKTRIASPPRKRRRIERVSLYHVIPEPHIYTVITPPSPPPYYRRFLARSPSPPPAPPKPQAPHAKAYTVTHTLQPLPESPYTPETLSEYLKDRNSRCAWIIPIRGTLPYTGCTSASVLDADVHLDPSSLRDILPCGPASHADQQDSPGSITWTSDALRSLWRFLLSVREARTMGYVALSFFCAPPSPSSMVASSGSSTNPNKDSSVQSGESARRPTPRMQDVDYFKIYLGTPYASNMRDLLHLWRYDYALQGGGTTRLRLLRGARLLLLDEANKGVLTW